MKLIYTTENQLLIHNAQNLLNEANIETQLRNEYISSAFGKLSSFTWFELCVMKDADYDQAVSLLHDMLEIEHEQWTCPQCQEENDAAFEYCWQCQSNRPSLSASQTAPAQLSP